MTVFDQLLRIEIADLFVPVQGGTVNDVVINIDQVNGLESFPNIVPVTNFVKDFLSNYPNPDDFYENISKNVTAEIFNNAETLGLAGTMDSVSIELIREPIATLPYPFVSQSIETSTGNTDQLTILQFKDLVIPVQGGTVGSATISLDYVDNLDSFPNIVPLTNFTRDFLTNYPNPDDFYEDVTQNLTDGIINNAEELGLAGAIDSVSLELRRGPNTGLPHPFFTTSISSPGSSSEQLVRVEFEDLFVPVQGGTVNDVVINIDQVNGLESFPNIVPVTNFVKDFLSNYPNPDDFYENISKNVTAEIFNNAETLGLAGTMDSVSIELIREPIATLPYPFVSQSIETSTGNTDQLTILQFKDLVIPVQGGTVGSATISLDYVDNLDSFPNIVPLTNFTRDFLTNYPNPNDFYEDVTQNLTETILNNAEELGLAGTLDSVSVKLRRGPNTGLPHPFFSKSTAIPTELSNNALTSEALEILPQDFPMILP